MRDPFFSLSHPFYDEKFRPGFMEILRGWVFLGMYMKTGSSSGNMDSTNNVVKEKKVARWRRKVYDFFEKKMWVTRIVHVKVTRAYRGER